MSAWVLRIIRRFTRSVPELSPSMSTSSYEEAVRALNTLQSNAAVLEKVKAERDRKRHLNLPDTVGFAKRAGVTLDDIDTLKVIHVSGTKGKGSTCAFCESLLRSHGYKTGFFSSPHLVEVRERIRINGRPLARDTFSTYFWETYNKLDNTKEDHDGAMPAYFRFLTIMAFNVFLKEKVDVAIMEVGIGGQYDCTNIARSPVVCGVSSLGLDHTSLLGDTVEKIAWHKAGIFKPGVPAVTAPQPGKSLDVLSDRAKEIGVPLHVAPCLDQYSWGARQMALGIPGEMQAVNASLALQLANIWMEDHKKGIAERKQYYTQQLKEAKSNNNVNKDAGDAGACIVPLKAGFPITDAMTTGLESCKWLGRNQTIKKESITYYLDGAHTPRSSCMNWFGPAAQAEANGISGRVLRVLMFNSTGDRDPDSLLSLLVPGDFDCAVFCPNVTANKADQVNLTVTKEVINTRCSTNRATWLRLLAQADSVSRSPTASSVSSVDRESPLKKPRLDDSLDWDSGVDSCETNSRGTPESDTHPTFIFHAILDTLNWVAQGRDPDLPTSQTTLEPMPTSFKDVKHVQVLITGSLHLVGGVLGVLTPDIND